VGLVEKLAYPHWTHPLLDAHPGLSMGLGHGSFMVIAAVVNSAWPSAVMGPLVRRISALVLAVMFTAAIFEFGKVDAIGHMMIMHPDRDNIRYRSGKSGPGGSSAGPPAFPCLPISGADWNDHPLLRQYFVLCRMS